MKFNFWLDTKLANLYPKNIKTLIFEGKTYVWNSFCTGVKPDKPHVLHFEMDVHTYRVTVMTTIRDLDDKSNPFL